MDRATERGIEVPLIDIGTALCVRGVDAGPFFVVPVMGPAHDARRACRHDRVQRRDLRDGRAVRRRDAPSIPVLIAVEVLSDVAALAMARNFDPGQPHGTDFDAVRDAYLEHRTRLCTEARARAAA